MRNDEKNAVSTETNKVAIGAQAGKIGKAFLMWMLGVPSGLVLVYLFFSSC